MRLSPLSSSSSHIYKGCEIEHTLDDGDYDDDDNENAANDDDNDDNNNDNNDNDDKFVSKLRFGFALRPVHQRRVPWLHGEGNHSNLLIEK